MTPTLKIANNIAAFENVWDRFLPEQHHLVSHHLAAFEHANIPDLNNYYVLVYLNGELIGLVYLQQFQFRQTNLNFPKNQTLLVKMANLILPSTLPLLICGHLLRINFEGFYFKNPAHQSYLLQTIDGFTKQRKKPYGIVVKDCPALLDNTQIKMYGYRFFDADVTMEIYRRAHWLSFDDYLQDLQKDYFKRAKKIITAFEPIKTITLSADQIVEQAGVIEKLYWNVVNKQSIKLGTVNAAYFYDLKTDLKDNFEFNAMYLADAMVGFYTFIFYENEMETHFIGLDYDVNRTHKLYFNILFCSVQKMIAQQFNKLELGRTAREAKVNLGAQPKQILNYVKLKNRLATVVLQYILKQFHKLAGNNLVVRTPLKKHS